ncbi:translation initiation factor IF-2 [Mycoplasmopsis agassizii]|uniref:Translation initiation factor IF-2 n=1 Tax=Mycoplasmopsis agassizii TaxID=33922 RepID=A0A269TKB1_9BACT|nr:translation initiation factor IF-2 [Mycoplasmopsis agassizii]PAK21506.1 translation initiation factor IF-2 [Mycoplasmopsis agassizii]
MAKKSKKERKTNIDQIETQLFNVKSGVENNKFIFSGPMTVAEFAQKTNSSGAEIVKKFFLAGKLYDLNKILSEEEIAELCFERNLDFQVVKEINAGNYLDTVEFSDEESELTTRAPIVTIVGHVDHGKTTLIDKIRKSKIAESEASGITQHTGAYQIFHNNKAITFLDTPGHEAFTAMRARGTKLTDIVILVVAADDGVMPQTKEAIAHTHAAKVPMIVFVNKMDKPDKDLEKLKSELSAADVVIEEWGGNVPVVYGSALLGEGIDELFQIINLTSEILDLKANFNRYPIGVVVESRLLKGVGAATTIIVKNGTLKLGDYIVAGSHQGRVKTMTDSESKNVSEALPGMPVRITGLSSSPMAGEKFIGFEDEKYAKKIASENERLIKREKFMQQTQTISLNISDKDNINIIIKADTEGTAEAIKHAVEKLSTKEFSINVVSASIGDVSNADLLLAQASNAKIYTFNVKSQNQISQSAKEKQIEIKEYNVIYHLIEDLQAYLDKNAEPIYELKLTGKAQILKIFTYSKLGNIAGCRVEDGSIKAGAIIKLIRKNKLVHEGVLDTLRSGLDDTKEVAKGFEFGTHIKDFNEIQEGDIIEAYEKIRIN